MGEVKMDGACMKDPEDLIEIYGEKYRRLIEDSLAWLDRKESEWGLEHPIDRALFVADLVSRAEV